jgi:hypothetical protein
MMESWDIGMLGLEKWGNGELGGLQVCMIA